MFGEVKKILMKYTEADNITPDSLLNADLGLSSFDVVYLVSDFEEAYHIQVSDRDIGKFISVADILDYLKEAIQKK